MKTSLVKQMGAVGGESAALMVLPDVFNAPVQVQETGLPPAPPYVQFMTRKAGSWEDTARAIPGLEPGNAVLFRPTERAVRLSPFRCHFVTGKQYWAQTDDSYKLESVRFEPTDEYTEYVDSVLLLYVGDALIPATCRFRGATCKAAQKMAGALQQAGTPEWGTLSPEHRASLGAPHPFARFFATVSTGAGTARGSGRVFVKADAAISPSGVVEATAVGNAFRDEAFKSALQEIAETYKRRVEEVTEVSGGR